MSDEDHEAEDDSVEETGGYDPPDFSRFFSVARNPIAAYRRDWSAGIGKMISNALGLRYQLPTQGIVVPRYELPVAANIGRAVTDFTGFNNAVHSALSSVSEQQASKWQEIFESLAKLRRAEYPENWVEGIDPTVLELETLLIDEGIPLMWVPGPTVVRALLDAPDAAARRRIIGQRWKQIASDSEAVVQDIEHPSLRHDCKFALDCVEALRSGHASAAQALAANLLDTIMRRRFANADRVKLTRHWDKQTKQSIRFDLDAYKFRASMTFAPVWRAHATYSPGNGSTIPRTFGRHPSAHAVSTRQYTRVNAVYALMLVASVLKFMDIHLAR